VLKDSKEKYGIRNISGEKFPKHKIRSANVERSIHQRCGIAGKCAHSGSRSPSEAA
jgi:hypothetical protein